MNAVLIVLAGVLGGVAGRVVDSLAVLVPERTGLRGGTAVRAVGPPWCELAGVVAAVGVTARFGWSAELPAWLWLVEVGLLLAVVDLRTLRLPNRVVLAGVVGAAVLLAGAAAVDGTWTALVRAALGGGVAFGVLFVLALIAPSGMGMGDVKLAGLLGLYLGWLGWPVLVTGLFLGFLVQAVLGLALMALRRAGRKTHLPFGPALIVGTLAAALLAGDWALLT